MNNFAITSPESKMTIQTQNADHTILKAQASIEPGTRIDTFDFENQKVVEMDLATLKRTYREDNTDEQPMQGIYHFEAIERAAALCRKNQLTYAIEEIFAAQNKNKNQPGVSLLRSIQNVYGNRAVEAHVLRRIFTTIRIDDGQNSDLTTTLALAIHQDGIQAAIGPCVKICHNQCILSPERMVSTYGKNKVSINQLFDTIDLWLQDFFGQMDTDRQRIEHMKNTALSPDDIYRFIGLLTSTRVAHDSKDKRLNEMVGPTYPLNQSQISDFTENLIKLKLEKGDTPLTIWDVYNVGTELYKPGQTDFPCLFSQNLALVDMLLQFKSENQA